MKKISLLLIGVALLSLGLSSPRISTDRTGSGGSGDMSKSTYDTNNDGKVDTSNNIGTLTNTKWCTSNGTTINCTENAPSGSGDMTKSVYDTDDNSKVDVAEDAEEVTCTGCVADSELASTFLKAEVDGSTTNELQDLSLLSNTLSLSGSAVAVDLSGYLDNTDSQDLSLSGNTLSLTGDATSVDLSGYLDNTDAQAISLNGNTLSITGSVGTVDLSKYLDNTDDQTCAEVSGCVPGALTTVDISSNTNLAAGRSLTMSGDSVEADAELYTDTKCIWFENPTDADDFKSIWVTNQAATITGISCESDQTVNLDLQIDDGTPADVNGSSIACTSTWGEDTSLAGDTSMGANDRLDLSVASTSGTPTWVSVCWEYEKSD